MHIDAEPRKFQETGGLRAVTPPSGDGARYGGDRPRSGSRARRAAVLLASGLLLAGTALAQTPAGAAGPRTVPAAPGPAAPSAEDEPINMAVAVDESHSLAPGDIGREKNAVSRIAVGELSSRSRMVAFGFASADDDKQSAVDPVCPVTVLDTAGRESIGRCAAGLKRREKNQGTGTDFPAAVSQGVHHLTDGTDPRTPRVLFLLTDGRLDVSDSAEYGPGSRRKQAGEDRLAEELEKARAAKVQIWPLGFGDEIDRAALDRIAAAGYQAGCPKRPDARPRAAEVPNAQDVGKALETAFAAAHCINRKPGGTGRPPTTLTVRVSRLATVGTIVVSKGDAKVTAEYTDPAGRKITRDGEDDGSTFTFAGRGQEVESLRVTDPVPGVWKVRLDAPEGHRDELATISVLWKGAVSTSVWLDPSAPKAGEKTVVSVNLQTRRGVKLKEREDLEGVTVAAVLTGDGFEPMPVRLTDDGEGDDESAHDGEFTGVVTVPGTADGALKVSSKLSAVGLTADERSAAARVAAPDEDLTAVLTIPDATVHPGGKVTGTLAVGNRDTTGHRLRLGIQDRDTGGLRITPSEVTVAPGESRTVDVTVQVGGSDEIDEPVTGDGVPLGGKAVVTDASDEDQVVGSVPLDITVEPRPSWWDRWWWAVIAGAALAVLLLALAASRRRLSRWQRGAGGLVLRLRGPNGWEAEHDTKSGKGIWYEFDIVDAGSDTPRLQRRPGGAYAVRRNPDGGAVVRAPGSGERLLRNGDSMTLRDELSLSVAEGGRRRPRRPGPRGSGAGRRRGPGPGGADPNASVSRTGGGDEYGATASYGPAVGGAKAYGDDEDM